VASNNNKVRDASASDNVRTTHQHNNMESPQTAAKKEMPFEIIEKVVKCFSVQLHGWQRAASGQVLPWPGPRSEHF
ncbi:hypothetical protein TSOC_003311, partial [Tetrabaena socialis]